MKKVIRVGIVENDIISLNELRSKINGSQQLFLVFEKTDDLTSVDMMELSKIDVLLLNYNLPIINDLIRFPILMATFPSLKIVFTGLEKWPELLSGIEKKGINGLILLNDSSSQIVHNLRLILKFGVYFDPTLRALINGYDERKCATNFGNFSISQLRLIDGLCSELNRKQIAAKLFISEKTVDYHLNQIKTMLGVKSTIGIVKYAIKHKLYSY
jgi:DNA-binding NarL/FixJ family response regulator